MLLPHVDIIKKEKQETQTLQQNGIYFVNNGCLRWSLCTKREGSIRDYNFAQVCLEMHRNGKHAF